MEEIVAINGLHFLPPECCNHQDGKPLTTDFSCISCTTIQNEPGCCSNIMTQPNTLCSGKNIWNIWRSIFATFGLVLLIIFFLPPNHPGLRVLEHVDCTWMPILIMCQIGLCGIMFELFWIRKRICVLDFCAYEKVSRLDDGQIQTTSWSLGKILSLIFNILNLVELFRIVENESCYDDVRQHGGDVFWTIIIIYSIVSACDIVLACTLWCCSLCGCHAYKFVFQNGTKQCVVGVTKCICGSCDCKYNWNRESATESLELDTGATDI